MRREGNNELVLCPPTCDVEMTPATSTRNPAAWHENPVAHRPPKQPYSLGTLYPPNGTPVPVAAPAAAATAPANPPAKDADISASNTRDRSADGT